VACWQI